ncbi:hypothetical protein J6590_052716 [Homalodisca vitripennis]|nr:hypothetical protein J6590_052716 [Homalodisca vitripennis]
MVIDVTFCSEGLAPAMTSWEVLPHATTSDHSLIFATFGERQEQAPEEQLGIETAVASLMECLQTACRVAIPKSAGGRRPVPWWNQRLERMRRSLHRLYRRVDRLPTTEAHQNSKERIMAIFVTENSQENSWGIAYKVLTGKLRTKQVLSGIMIPGSPATMV